MNARQVALDVLSDVLKNKTYLNLELKRALQEDREDKRFITALISTTIENLYRIDYVLNRFITAKRVHTVIRNILRLGACQLLFFESVPVSAAVNESVKLTEKNGKRQLKGFVNATLRNLSQHLGSISYPDPTEDIVEYLHVFYSYPKWLCEKYVGEYGAEETEKMFSYHADNARTCIRQNKLKGASLSSQFDPGLYCDDAYYIRNASSIERMPLFRQGAITVQGEASMLCVRAAGIKSGDRVLDVCAAPGGKSIYAAQLARNGSVMALDIHEHRVALIKSNAERMGVQNVEAYVADATQYDSRWDGFDVVLADVPCSALGLLYRKPDIKLFKEQEDIAQLVEIQRKILENCAKYVKRGGALLYSTCTIDKEENEDNVEWFLQMHPDFQRSDIRSYIPEQLMYRAKDGAMQLLPYVDHVDGFFMARMERI